MSETGTTQRVLRLLALLQQRPVWTGPELAHRLGVTTRSVRRDVERLRDLGYPVNAAPGVGGGYQLGAGKALTGMVKRIAPEISGSAVGTPADIETLLKTL